MTAAFQAHARPDIQWPQLGEPVARIVWGKPTTETSKELRWGTHGSRALNRQAGTWFDHEANHGGGTLDLVPGTDMAEKMRWLAEHRLIDGSHRGQSTITAKYNYVDETGKLLFQVVRFEPKDFRQRRRDGSGNWTWSLGDTRRVLYRLPEIMAAVERGEIIYIVEGEKDAHILSDHGLTATCNPGGASKWRPEYSEALRGADVAIVGDNDDPGRAHAQQVATALHGVARRVRVLDLTTDRPDLPVKEDVSWWLANGGTAEKLQALVEALPDWTPDPKQQDAAARVDRPLTAAEFLRLELPPRQRIIAPWLPDKGLTMVYSPRGMGKTLFGLTCAYGIASGAGFLGFSIEKPRKVLYVDGEMPAQTMQERLAAIIAGFAGQPPTNDHFRILLSDLTESGLPDLATPGGQAWIDARAGDAEIIFIDNLSTIARSGKENEAEGWRPVQSWALAQRRVGHSLVFLHHAGKSGAQRGTSHREDVLDSVISLRRPADYSPDQGARFELHYDKHRGFYGDDAQPFEARYEVRAGAAKWTRTEIVDAERARVVAALQDGMSIRDAAEALGIHKSKVERLRRKAMEAGEFAPTSEAAE